MKNFFKMFFIILTKIIFCLFLTLLILYFNFIVIVTIGASDTIDWQIILYNLFSVFVLLIIWFLIFAKIKIKYKFLLIVPVFIWLFLPKFLPNVMKQFDLDSCLDTGLCREGIIKMQDNKGNAIPINKENCTNNGYVWYEKDKACNLRKK